MRAEILKIAGVKTEKEFYKKFPTEEAFMKKHGKAFKKAKDGFMDKMGGVAGLTDIAGDAMGIISAFGQQNKMKEQTEQDKQLTGLNVMAMASQPEEIENQYYRPEDMLIQPGNLHNPYGTGTVIQDGATLPKKYGKAQGGKTISGNVRGGFMDWFGKPATSDQYDEEGNMIQTGMNNGQMVAQTMDQVANVAGLKNHESAWGKVGNLTGKLAGKLIPIPGAGEILGKGLELVGSALDPTAKKIKKNQDAITRNMNKMTGMGVGAGIQQQYNAVVQDGGEVSLGDQIRTHWGGSAKPISYNPFLPDGGETVEFHGRPHTASNIKGQSGIGVSFDKAQDGSSQGVDVEVEDGEVATKLPDEKGGENVVVYGNLPITKIGAEMLGDPMAKGKKVKNYVKAISKDEEKSNRALARNTKTMNELDVRTSFNKLKLKGLEAMDMGHNMRLKIAADKKQNAAMFQNAVNETADEFGIVANDLARGKIKKDTGKFVPSNATTAQRGDEIPINQDGSEEEKLMIGREEVEKYIKDGWVQDPDNEDRLILKGKKGEIIDTVTKGKGEGSYKVEGGESDVTVEGILSDPKKYKTFHDRMKGAPEADMKAAAEELYSKGIMPGQWQTPVKASTRTADTLDRYAYIRPRNEMGIGDQEDEDGGKKFGIGDAMAIANGILPYARPTDQDDFDYGQLYGEMYALAHNKVEPVKAQKYYPQLDVPYDISLQDQRNEVIAATRAASKLAGYNPAAQAMIASQAYEPLNKISAEEFRLNQAKKDQVYSGNRATMNQAQLTNLGILADQAEKQSIAKSKTKEATQLALDSVGNKLMQHKFENRRLGILENAYNYRFGKDNVAQNYNPFARFNMQGSGNLNMMTDDQKLLYYEDQADILKKARRDKLKAAGKTNDWNSGYGQDGTAIKKTNLVKALKNY